MKYTSILVLVVVFIAQGASAQQIVFKDQNLKSALLKKGYDFNKNGEIEVSEIDTVSKLNISKSNIRRLDDLKYFNSLKKVYAMSNQIANLDVFFDNNIIEEIYIGENALGKKLALNNVKNLTILAAARNGLDTIELNGTDNIKQLYLQANSFKNIKFKNLTNLSTLELIDNKTLKIIDISSNPALSYLNLLSTAISQLDISNNKLLSTFYVVNTVKVIKSASLKNTEAAPVVRERH
jgi:hypothetical protein